MKILDKYLLKTFLITFTTVFVILFFIFILQTVWLFISEITGKGLDFLMILKFLVFAMPRLIPLVLPLSVVLSSIMTFGSLSENYEFAAMKSSGISLQRAMKSIVVFIVILSLVSFWFANNVIPYAEFKFVNFRRNIAQLRPSMAIAEGQFNKIGTYTIKVDKKSGKDGNFLSNVTIHRTASTGEGNITVIKAKTGELISSEASNNLQLVLKNGYYYEDVLPAKYEERVKIPFAKATFKKDIINIDLSKLNQNADNSIVSNTDAMQNFKELRYTIDSLNTDYKKEAISNSENAFQRIGLSNTYSISNDSVSLNSNFVKEILKKFPKTKQLEIYKIALNNIENSGFSLDSSVIEMDNKQKNLNTHWIALYDKFMVAFSCLLMFFIGAPLGAIIRKGGLGLPIVFAVTIFIIFHFINTFGKRVAQENGMSPFLGTWMSTLILLPLAVLLTYKATNDHGETINLDFITEPIRKFLDSKKQAVKSKIDTQLLTFSNEKLIRIVTNFKVFNYPENYISKAVQVLKDRGISNEVISKLNYFNVNESLEIEKNKIEYKKYSTIALLLNFLSILIGFFAIKYHSKTVLFLLIICIISLSVLVFITQKKLNTIGKIIGKYFDPSTLVSTIVAFPFYFIIYLFSIKELKKALIPQSFDSFFEDFNALNFNEIKSINVGLTIKEYKNNSKIALLLYIILMIVFILFLKYNTTLILSIGILIFIAFLYFNVISQIKLAALGKEKKKEFEPGIEIATVVGFPFYPIIYYLNNKELQTILEK